MHTVQFRGVEAVVEAYRLNKIGPWAILCGKTIVAACEAVDTDDVDAGGDQLQDFLDSMKKHGTEGRYMLQVYKLKQGQEIDPATKPYRGFYFTLFENKFEGSNSENGVYQLIKKMDERLDRLEAEKEAGVEAGEGMEGKGFMGKIGSMAEGLIANPRVQEAIAIGAMNFIRKTFNMGNSLPGKVAGVEKPDDESDSLLTQEQVDKVHVALSRLSRVDAKLGDNLLKVARIAETDKGKYDMAIKFL
jgi:hypothetical protein